jgi:hypothetical protein
MLATAAFLAAAWLGGRVDQWVGGVAAAAVAAPFVIYLLRQRAARRHRIIASVRDRAAGMDPDELAGMVGALEEAYGEDDMRSLRELLPGGGSC